MSWPMVTLGEICKPKQWKTLSKKELLPEGNPVYSANGQIGFTSAYTHEEPTILVGCRGSCGTVHVMPAYGYANGNAMALGNLDRDKVDISFAARYLRRRGFSDITTGSSQPQIIRSRIETVEMPLPPLPEQRRIAGILDAAYALRRRRRRAIETLDTLQRALFAEMFGDQADVAHVPLHELCRPKQWKTIPKSAMTDTGFPVYGANGKIGFYSEFNHSEPTILITCRGATCGEINISEPQSYVTGNAMALDDLDEEQILLPVMEAALRVRGFHDAITGTAQPQITRQSLQVVTVPVPPMEKQETFMRLANSLPKSRAAMTTHLAHLDVLFAALQSRAFAGEL